MTPTAAEVVVDAMMVVEEEVLVVDWATAREADARATRTVVVFMLRGCKRGGYLKMERECDGEVKRNIII